MLGAIFGGLSILGSIYSAYKQYEAQEAGEELQNRQLDIAQQQVNVMKQGQRLSEQQQAAAQFAYNQFQQTYGSIEQNMADYFSNLTADSLNTKMQDALTQRFSQAQERLNQNMALRGIQGSGVQAGAQSNLASTEALARAQADIQAPEMVAQQQAQFYNQTARPQQNMLNNNLQNANMQQLNSYGNLANSYGNVSNQLGQQAANKFNLANQYGQSAAGFATAGGYLLGKQDPLANFGQSPQYQANGFTAQQNAEWSKEF